MGDMADLVVIGAIDGRAFQQGRRKFGGREADVLGVIHGVGSCCGIGLGQSVSGGSVPAGLGIGQHLLEALQGEADAPGDFHVEVMIGAGQFVLPERFGGHAGFRGKLFGVEPQAKAAVVVALGLAPCRILICLHDGLLFWRNKRRWRQKVSTWPAPAPNGAPSQPCSVAENGLAPVALRPCRTAARYDLYRHR
jgi:hypothetical protein